MLTACHRSEITDLRWSEVNLRKSVLEIAPERYKTGVPFVVPLVDTAADFLRRQERQALAGPYVFSGVGKDGEKPYTG